MAAFGTKKFHITLLLGHWLQKSLKRIETSSMPIELWALNFEKKCKKWVDFAQISSKKKGDTIKLQAFSNSLLHYFPLI